MKVKDLTCMKSLKAVYSILLIAICLLGTGSVLSQNCSNTSTGFPPINDLAQNFFRNFQGGLYPDGSNQRPLYHDGNGITIGKGIVPLDTSGNINYNTGKVVLLSVGMSNCNQEFGEFKTQLTGATYLNPKLVLINGAQGSQTIDKIINPNAEFWSRIEQMLANAGLTTKQVQVVWFKEAEAGPRDTTFPGYPLSLKNKFKTAMGIMKDKYVNLKLCYNASRIYAGYSISTLNPEPYAYYSGWSVKWMIEDQINGDTSLIYKGVNANSPWLSWGPYIWADGINPRIDGLTWVCPQDFNSDGTHPSVTGRIKVANMLIDFFKTDESAKPWFLKTFTLNLTIAIQGFYDPALNCQRISDTMRVYARNVNPPYNSVDSAVSEVDSVSLKGIFKFYNLPNGTFYFQIRHRNNIETWSKAGGESVIFGAISDYSFTDSQSKAFGNNQIIVDNSPVVYATFSGDVNQDGYVDLSDVSTTFNDAGNFMSGYVNTDSNGDNLTDLGDLIIVYNNSLGFVQKITP